VTIEVRIRKFYNLDDDGTKMEMVPAVSFLSPDVGPSPEALKASLMVFDKFAKEMAEEQGLVVTEMSDDEIKDYRKSEGDEEGSGVVVG